MVSGDLIGEFVEMIIAPSSHLAMRGTLFARLWWLHEERYGKQQQQRYIYISVLKKLLYPHSQAHSNPALYSPGELQKRDDDDDDDVPRPSRGPSPPHVSAAVLLLLLLVATTIFERRRDPWEIRTRVDAVSSSADDRRWIGNDEVVTPRPRPRRRLPATPNRPAPDVPVPTGPGCASESRVTTNVVTSPRSWPVEASD